MDLSNPSNWSQIVNVEQRAVLNTYPNGGFQSRFLEPFVGTLATPVCIAKISILDAPDSFPVFGGWLSFHVPLIGSLTRVTSRELYSQTPLLIRLPVLDIIPYTVQMNFSPKLSAVLFEIWQFTDQSGKYLESSQQAILSAVEVVEQRESELEALVKQIQPLQNYELTLEE